MLVTIHFEIPFNYFILHDLNYFDFPNHFVNYSIVLLILLQFPQLTQVITLRS